MLEARASGREADVIAFIQSAIADHKAGRIYQTAADAQLYYDGENPTINRYEKIIYDMQGRAHRDMWTANHKIASKFFGIVVDQETGYLLGNGVNFKKDSTKKKLGKKFDRQIHSAGEYALIGGVSFGFWNLDHLEVFPVTEFVPLEDEENGSLSAGIRFWKIAQDRPLRCTLYELDGFTEYIQRPGEEMKIMDGGEKRPYILHVTETAADRTKIYNGENYPTFPIVPLKNNRHCKSELVGRRNTVDALDLACSNMINNVDEGNLIYWVLTNCGGMDEEGAVKFLDRVRTTHISWAENGDEGSSAAPHAIEAPFEGTQTTIDMLEKKLYQDFQAFDSSAVTASNQSATAIKASYVPLDLKVDKFERQVTEFISGILALAGIDDEPTYTRNRIINEQEEMQTVLMAAQYFDEEYITRKTLTILGDGDMADEILKRRAADDLGRFDGNNPQDGGNEPEEGEENGNG
nr:phage portal protein [Pseudoflavonifractor sp. 524-17]